MRLRVAEGTHRALDAIVEASGTLQGTIAAWGGRTDPVGTIRQLKRSSESQPFPSAPRRV